MFKLRVAIDRNRLLSRGDTRRNYDFQGNCAVVIGFLQANMFKAILVLYYFYFRDIGLLASDADRGYFLILIFLPVRDSDFQLGADADGGRLQGHRTGDCEFDGIVRAVAVLGSDRVHRIAGLATGFQPDAEQSPGGFGRSQGFPGVNRLVVAVVDGHRAFGVAPALQRELAAAGAFHRVDRCRPPYHRRYFVFCVTGGG